MKVVTRAAMSTIIVKIRGERIPRSYPILSAISSTRPRVFISAPIEIESGQLIPVQRAATMLPPNLPAMATPMMHRQKRRLD
ncbi:MAG: hypothetical protein A2W26_08740 [Acidobacteria bacterium RBG_16_64_8]|nr:MAG: hypothetical protein A2W26_08740 [Acidobacteria bacterium RBG_16_64_8]